MALRASTMCWSLLELAGDQCLLCKCTNKGQEWSLCLAWPMWTVVQDDQIVGKGKQVLTGGLPAKERRRVTVGVRCSPSEITELGLEISWHSSLQVQSLSELSPGLIRLLMLKQWAIPTSLKLETETSHASWSSEGGRGKQSCKDHLKPNPIKPSLWWSAYRKCGDRRWVRATRKQKVQEGDSTGQMTWFL